MIGHRKFAWKVENLLPSEWFDLDREVIDMQFDPETQPPDDYDDDDWEESEPYTCPVCGNDDLNLMFWHDESFYGGSARRLQCEDCGHEFDVDMPDAEV